MSEDKNKNSELVAAGVFQRRESGEQELADDIVVPDPNAIPELDKFNAFKDLMIQAPAKSIIGTLCDGVLIALERGPYSATERLRWKEFKDIVDMLPEVARALVSLGEKIDAKEMPSASDIAATIEAYQRASRKTQNAAKRKYLRNALRNSFNKDAYLHGMTITFFRILESLEYPEIKLLSTRCEISIETDDYYNQFPYFAPKLDENLAIKLESFKKDQYQSDNLTAYLVHRLVQAKLLEKPTTDDITPSSLGRRFIDFISADMSD